MLQLPGVSDACLQKLSSLGSQRSHSSVLSRIKRSCSCMQFSSCCWRFLISQLHKQPVNVIVSSMLQQSIVHYARCLTDGTLQAAVQLWLVLVMMLLMHFGPYRFRLQRLLLLLLLLFLVGSHMNVPWAASDF